MNSQNKEALRRDDENARPINDPKLIVAEAYDQIAERYLKWRGQQPREGELGRWLGLLSGEVQP